MGDNKSMSRAALKEIILAVIFIACTASAFWFWRVAAIQIANGVFSHYAELIIPATLLILAAVCFGFSSLFIKNKKILYPAVAGSAIMPFMLIPPTKPLLVALVLSIGMLLFAATRIRSEQELSVGISMPKLFKMGIPLYFTVASLIISFFYLDAIRGKDGVETLLPRKAFDLTFRAFAGPLKSITGANSLDAHMTVDQFLESALTKQLEEKGITFSSVPKAEIMRLFTDQRARIAEQYGVKLTGKETIGDVFYGAVISRIDDLLGPYRSYIPYASAIAFFLAFKTIAIIMYLLVLLAGYVLLKILLGANIVMSKKEQIEIEKLEF